VLGDYDVCDLRSRSDVWYIPSRRNVKARKLEGKQRSFLSVASKLTDTGDDIKCGSEKCCRIFTIDSV